MNFVKKPHTAIFSGPTDCGKTKLVLDLVEKEYKDHFENIIILCPTLRWNKTYLERSWVWKDDYVFCIDLNKGSLIKYIKTLSNLLAKETSLFIIDDCIADDALDKTRSELLALATSGRHKEHTLWFLTQCYTAIPKRIRRQKKQLFVWYPSEKSDLKLIDEETNIMTTSEQLAEANEVLKKSEHAVLYFRMKHPRGYHIIP